MSQSGATLSDDPMRPKIPLEIGKVVTDASAYGTGDVFAAFDWLRKNQPLGIVETDDFDPFWVATKHADLRVLATKPDVFLSGQSNITLMDKEETAHMIAAMNGRPSPIRHIIIMDAPDHALYRALTVEHFTPRALVGLEDKVRAIANQFLDAMAETGGECDFGKVVAFVYPLRVVMSVIGVPPEDEAHLLKLTQQLVGSRDPEQARGGHALSGAEAAASQIAVVDDFNDYFSNIRADRQANPRDDIASVIANAKIDGKPIPKLESDSYYVVLATAGHDTTAASTAGAIIELARNPAEFAKLKANPALAQSMVEEAVRWTSPSKLTMRSAAQDIEICNRQFRKGEIVGLAWASANRDEEVFEDPYTFKIDRRPNRLMGFGYGPHVCLGQHLARLEMRILFEEFAKRVESLELTGSVRSVDSFQISGPKSAPIRFKMK